MRKIIKITAIVLAVFFILLLSIPFLFKDKIKKVVKEEAVTQINKSLNATVSIGDVNLSIIKYFPKLNISVENIAIVGKDVFEKDTLLSAKEAGFNVNILEIWKNMNDIKVRGIFLDEPRIHLITLADGKSNYDIVPEDTTTAQPSQDTSNFQFALDNYKITKAYIKYEDFKGDMFAEIDGLDHSGSGNFNPNKFDFDILTKIQSLDFRMSGIPYMQKTKIDWKALLDIDMAARKYALKENKLVINDLNLLVDGYVQMPDTQTTRVDMKIEAPGNEFKNLISLIPAFYLNDYKNLKADGKFDFKSTIKGDYNTVKKLFPSIIASLNIQNGNIKYPDLPMGIKNMDANINVATNSDDPDQLKIDIPKLSLVLGDNPLQASFILRTPVSDPYIKGNLNGTINLGQIKQMMKVQDLNQLEGIIKAAIDLETKMSYVEKAQYDKIKFNGNINASALKIKYGTYPLINITSAGASLSPQKIAIGQMSGNLGKSDVAMSGYINNPLAYFSPKASMDGFIKFNSNSFDADEWMTTTEPSKTHEISSAESESTNNEALNHMNIGIDANIGRLTYKPYDIKNLVAKGKVSTNYLKLDLLSLLINGSDIAASGEIKNAMDWMDNKAVMTGNINLRSRMLDMNTFMSDASKAPEAGTTTTASEPAEIPANIDLKVNANIDKLIYTNMQIDALKGELVVANQEAQLKNVTGNTLGGSAAFTGLYSTKNVEKPGFNIKMDLNKMDFQKAFNTFNSFSKLAPIGKYLFGSFSTSMILSGNLMKDMSPDLSSFSASGFIETINALIKGFKPLDEIGTKLNISDVKNMQLKNSKNWFEIVNGAVELKEFDMNAIKDIPMKISGKHSLTNEMDYLIKTKIPRKLLEKNQAGQAVNTGLNFLSGQASKLGINIAQGEFINMNINIKGSISQPKIGFNVTGTDGKSTLQEQAANTLNEAKQKAIDSVKTRANQELEKAKQEAAKAAERAADSLKRIAQNEANKALEEAKKKAGNEIKDKLGPKADSIINKTTGKGVDEIKDQLKKFDPFKKKK